MQGEMSSAPGATTPTGQKEPLLQGRYRITRILGSGGMGDVFLADDLRLSRQVAIKSIKREFCKMDEVRKRIERECVMHAQLGAHPNIIALFDRIDDNGQIHLVMEYVDGVTLKDVIDRARNGELYLTWRESTSIACQVLEALARMHGGVHVEAHSAGSRPSGVINPKAVRFMAELGYDLAAHGSKSLDEIAGIDFDAVITMGCGDSCPWVPAKRREDWALPDPKHMDDEAYRAVRDDIAARVRRLLAELGVPA